MIENFNDTIDTWIAALQHYNFIQLCAKPSPRSWSLGQVYLHLIEDTKYYLEQIKVCVSADDNIMEQASPFAKKIFLNNGFPDIAIEGAASNAYIPQPNSKQELISCMTSLKDEMNNAEMLISKSQYKGKTKHPGLGYFNANEWLQFAEIHFRHHLRQKKKIDDFLKTNLQYL